VTAPPGALGLTLGPALGAAAARALRRPAPRRAALALAAARGRALVLLYHRVTPPGAAAGGVVPSVPAALLRAHLEALRSAGDVVPLAELEAGRPGRRVRFAVTFDDDEPSHARHALPVLRALGVPATFFLQGLALHGLGPPWWVRLERAIARRGLAAVAAALGVAAPTAAALAARCEGTPLADAVARAFPADDGHDDGRDDGGRDDAVLSAAGVRALAAAGMEVGFHTVAHPVLPLLADADAARALADGRDALAAAAGRAVERFAYPHGRVDRRVAGLARAAGYRAAYRSANRPVGPGADRWALGRWEPGPLAPDALLAWAAWRLTLPVGGPPPATPPATGGRAATAPPRAAPRPR
jgi:peptidoglycan/xylan/chitin deacetylase (PgdA/CDA1 family)